MLEFEARSSEYMLAKWYRNTILPRLLTRVMDSDDLREIRKRVVADASGVVLEIGSGPGFNIPLYVNIDALYQLEPSQKLIDVARKQTVNGDFSVTFLRGTAEHIPLADGFVDTVVSTWTLCSVDDPAKVLSEIKRVLRPGGKFIFSDHGRSPRRIIALGQRMITPFTKAFTGNCHHDRDIAQLIIDAGFQITTMEHPSESRHPLIYNFHGKASTTKPGTS